MGGSLKPAARTGCSLLRQPLRQGNEIQTNQLPVVVAEMGWKHEATAKACTLCDITYEEARMFLPQQPIRPLDSRQFTLTFQGHEVDQVSLRVDNSPSAVPQTVVSCFTPEAFGPCVRWRSPVTPTGRLQQKTRTWKGSARSPGRDRLAKFGQDLLPKGSCWCFPHGA